MRDAGFPNRIAPRGEMISLRQREGRHAEHGAFHRGGDGAGIDHVLGGVAAAIDAGQDQIRRMLHDVTHAHDDAIGRRALDGKAPLVDFAQAQRIVERQRMRHAGLIGLGCYDPDVVGQSARDFLAGL